MTAYRVVDDHKELDNVGSHSHDEIDSHIETTPFVVLSGTNIPLTSSARYIEAGANVSIVDNGPGGSLVISSTGNDEYVFPNDLTVSLPGGKSFGRYATGATIPATGKTPAEVILLAIAEPIDPTTSITGTNILTTSFNTTGSITTSLTGSYVINSLGASVASSQLSYRTGGSGAWTDLSISTSNPLFHAHNFSVAPFYTTTINYRYIVNDTQGASNISYFNIVPQGYAAPTMSLNISRLTNGGVAGETNLKREKGNTSSIITGTITRQRPKVAITSYSVQYSFNGSTWTDVPSLSNVTVTGNPAVVNIPSTTHNEVTLLTRTTIYYRIRVTDEYTSTNSSNVILAFLDAIFYGPSEFTPTDQAAVRSLPSKTFIDSANPFNLETGSSYKNFTVALPTSQVITEVLDLDALNANITANYTLSNFDIVDGGGTAVNYNVYKMSNAIPYTSNHRHKITRS